MHRHRFLRITHGNKRPAEMETDCAIIIRGAPTITDGYGIGQNKSISSSSCKQLDWYAGELWVISSSCKQLDWYAAELWVISNLNQEGF